MKTIRLNRVQQMSFLEKSVTLFVILLLATTTSYAEKNSIAFDYCNFKIENNSKTNLEIYCQFSNSKLSFLKTEEGFTANAEINIILYDKEGEFVDEILVNRDIHEIQYDKTIDHGQKTLVQFNFEVEPGKYLVHITIEDSNNGNIFEMKRDVVAKEFNENELSLSDVEVVTDVQPSDEKSNFVKNGRKILANPTHYFDSENSNIKFYFEIYNLNVEENNTENKFQFSYRVKNSAGKVVRKYSNRYLKPYHSTSIDFSVPVKNLPGDTYSLDVIILDEDTDAKVEKSTNFTLRKSPLDIEHKNFDDVLAMLQMIAEKGELTEIKKVALDNRRQALQDFWQSKDPSPGTSENELMVQFYSRIDYANKHFSTPHVDGWKTDRGKIFIKFGKPDRVTRSVPITSWNRYEKWEYWTKGKNFLFGDRFGFGNYTLVNHLLY